MRIAVCIYGQPRFMKETAPFFQQEFFDFPGHKVDVFIHAWDRLGYSPGCEGNLEKLNHDQLQNDINDAYGDNLKDVRIDSAEGDFEQDIQAWEQVHNAIKKFHKTKYNDREVNKFLTSERVMDNVHKDQWSYLFGQYYSLSRAIDMKMRYAHKHNVKYDLVIRTRTDIAYQWWESSKNYRRYKEEYYQNLVKKKGIYATYINLKPFGSPDNVYSLSHLEVDNTGISSIGYRYPREFNYCDTVFNDSGVPSHTCQLYLKDWVMYADDESANSWVDITGSYYTFLFNQIVRYKGGKQVNYITSGEALNGFHALLNRIPVYRTPNRSFKLIHPDISLRTTWSKKNNNYENYKADHVLIASDYDCMVQQQKDYQNEECSFYTHKELLGESKQ